MRTTVAVAAAVAAAVAVFLLGWSFDSRPDHGPAVVALTAELATLHASLCVEVALAQASNDLLRIEMESQHGPPGERAVSDEHQSAIQEVFERVYARPPANRLLC